MVAPARPAANGFISAARHIYNPIGFSKGYNFVLWFIFAGALLGFSAARVPYLNFDGVYCSPVEGPIDGAAPGECWSYKQEDYLLLGIKLHLYTVIPGGFLAFLQFLPVLRHKVTIFHRINGYITILLGVAGTAGAFMIARASFGGGIDVQVAVALVGITFVVSMAMALYNIKRLQIEQHRKWMLRAWFYAGAIISCRLIQFSASIIISVWNPMYITMACDKMMSFYEEDLDDFLVSYPTCENLDAYVAVKADLVDGKEENAAAALNMTFGIGILIALFLHAVGVEIYLHLTPAESERLRNISYLRQQRAGYKDPGRGGLTNDRLGDAKLWEPSEGPGTKIMATARSDYEMVPEPYKTHPNDPDAAVMTGLRYDPYVPQSHENRSDQALMPATHEHGIAERRALL